MKHDIFISYTHKDKAFADKLCSEYETNGIKCWISHRDIPLAEQWAKAISMAIPESKILTVLISSNSVHSRQILREIEEAISKGVIVLPIKLDNIEITGAIKYYLSTVQWMDASNDFDKSLNRIMNDSMKILQSMRKSPIDTTNRNSADFTVTENTSVLQSTAKFEPYSCNKPYVFISYSHRDTDIVLPIIRSWHNAGYRIWYDEGIDPGNEWRKDIANRLNDCAYFVIFISPNSITSKNVKNELNFAETKEKPFLAVHITQTELPPEILLTIGSFQAIMKYKMSDSDFYYKIYKTLPAILKNK